MIDRVVDGLLVLLLASATTFALGVLGEAIDRGNELGVGLACFFAAVGIAGVVFFGRDLLRGCPNVEPLPLTARDHGVRPNDACPARRPDSVDLGVCPQCPNRARGGCTPTCSTLAWWRAEGNELAQRRTA